MKRNTLALAVAASVSVGGFFTVSRTTRTTPGITFSNVLLLPAKDGRVVRSTLVPKPTWRGGQTWIITIAHPAPFGTETLTVRQLQRGNFTYTDSIFQPFPSCVPYRLTVKPDTVLTTTGAVSTRRDSLTARLTLCRALTGAEIAEQDSFPSSSFKILTCRGALPSSTPDTVKLLVGDTVQLGATVRNRYTGRVMLVSGDPIACESARKSRESERDS